MSNRTVELSDGTVVEVTAVSDTLIGMAQEAVRRRFVEAGEPITPPTYTVEHPGGATSQEPHDETTLETDADRAAWAAHKDALARLATAQSEAQMKVWFSGLVFEMPADDTWIERQRWMGVDVPEGALEQRYHYVITELVKTPEDMFRVLEAITAVSYEGAITEDDLSSAIRSFRNQLQAKPAVPANGAGGKKPVDAQPTPAGTTDGSELGLDADGV